MAILGRAPSATLETMFGIADYGAFCAAILLFLALPGPGTFTLLTSTGQGGLRAGAAATAGVVIGDQILLWLAVGGVAALLATHPAWFKAVQYMGAAYLGWVGLRLLITPHDVQATASTGAKAPKVPPRHHLRQALTITLLNPKAIVFYMAFFPLFIDPATHRGAATFAAMALTIALITIVYCLTLCTFAQALSQRLRGHRRLARVLQRTAGAVLMGFGLRLVRD